MHAPAAKLQHRGDIGTQRIANHRELHRRDIDLGEYAGVGRRVLLADDLDPAKQAGQARFQDIGLRTPAHR
jgi:hypothetical protein